MYIFCSIFFILVPRSKKLCKVLCFLVVCCFFCCSLLCFLCFISSTNYKFIKYIYFLLQYFFILALDSNKLCKVLCFLVICCIFFVLFYQQIINSLKIYCIFCNIFYLGCAPKRVKFCSCVFFGV